MLRDFWIVFVLSLDLEVDRELFPCLWFCLEVVVLICILVDFVIVVLMVVMNMVDCLEDLAYWHLVEDHSCLFVVELACLCHSSLA